MAEYTMDKYFDFFDSILTATVKTLTDLGGGKHGHTWLIFDDSGYTNYMGKNVT